MGCCCSCWSKKSKDHDDKPGGGGETEMSNNASVSEKSLSISRAMTASTIEVSQENAAVSGYGLALAGVALEQDAAYWEVHIDIPEGSSASYEIMFGVATKKDRKFYNAIQEQEEDMPSTTGTDLMRRIPVKNGDAVGIAVQYSDLPMLQFLLNGEPLHSLAVNRFRGTVYPAVFLPENEGVTARVVFAERDFLQLPPHAKFGPVIVARGIL